MADNKYNTDNTNPALDISTADFGMAAEVLHRVSMITSAFQPELILLPNGENRIISRILNRTDLLLPHYYSLDNFLSRMLTVPEFLIRLYSSDRGFDLEPLLFSWFDPMRLFQPWLFQQSDELDEDSIHIYDNETGPVNDKEGKPDRLIRSGRDSYIAGRDSKIIRSMYRKFKTGEHDFNSGKERETLNNYRALGLFSDVPFFIERQAEYNTSRRNRSMRPETSEFIDRIISRIIPNTGNFEPVDLSEVKSGDWQHVRYPESSGKIQLSSIEDSDLIKLNTSSFVINRDNQIPELKLESGKIFARGDLKISGNQETVPLSVREQQQSHQYMENRSVPEEHSFSNVYRFKPIVDPEKTTAQKFDLAGMLRADFQPASLSNVILPHSRLKIDEQQEYMSESAGERRTAGDNVDVIRDSGGQQPTSELNEFVSESPVEPGRVNIILNTMISSMSNAGQSLFGTSRAMPELALAPVMRQVEAGGSTNAASESDSSGGHSEETSADLDAEQLATEVYGILKRRLFIERERMQGIVR